MYFILICCDVSKRLSKLAGQNGKIVRGKQGLWDLRGINVIGGGKIGPFFRAAYSRMEFLRQAGKTEVHIYP
ncbi:hypothetical protein ASG68_05130 [Rhizobium sp. Leaf453]|nr:hypothetical protein ASG42_12400 [Rhizobium sp. Leaf391]KQS94783.1 hypothetical protein ASG50_26350 [Rhizobium sp. Leaf386]KQU01161.1 hypothetical protein ASG68_05130 [Rhizobium sp. Leaf453]